jgi:hypothetical protein
MCHNLHRLVELRLDFAHRKPGVMQVTQVFRIQDLNTDYRRPDDWADGEAQAKQSNLT